MKLFWSMLLMCSVALAQTPNPQPGSLSNSGSNAPGSPFWQDSQGNTWASYVYCAIGGERDLHLESGGVPGAPVPGNPRPPARPEGSCGSWNVSRSANGSRIHLVLQGSQPCNNSSESNSSGREPVKLKPGETVRIDILLGNAGQAQVSASARWIPTKNGKPKFSELDVMARPGPTLNVVVPINPRSVGSRAVYGLVPSPGMASTVGYVGAMRARPYIWIWSPHENPLGTSERIITPPLGGAAAWSREDGSVEGQLPLPAGLPAGFRIWFVLLTMDESGGILVSQPEDIEIF